MPTDQQNDDSARQQGRKGGRPKALTSVNGKLLEHYAKQEKCRLRKFVKR